MSDLLDKLLHGKDKDAVEQVEEKAPDMEEAEEAEEAEKEAVSLSEEDSVVKKKKIKRNE